MLFSFNSFSNNNKAVKDSSYIEVTKLISIKEFIIIKNFILKKAQTMTYCNMYNNNPYYKFANFNVYLNPDVGQKNINCDPKLSDFNEIVIQNFKDKESIYYPIFICRKGDKKQFNISSNYPFKEGNTYLSTTYLEQAGSINGMKNNLKNIYVKELLIEINKQ